MARSDSIIRIPVKASRTSKSVQFDPETLEKLEGFIQMHELTHGAKPDFSDSVNALLEVILAKQPGLSSFATELRKTKKKG